MVHSRRPDQLPYLLDRDGDAQCEENQRQSGARNGGRSVQVEDRRCPERQPSPQNETDT